MIKDISSLYQVEGGDGIDTWLSVDDERARWWNCWALCTCCLDEEHDDSAFRRYCAKLFRLNDPSSSSVNDQYFEKYDKQEFIDKLN